MVSLIGDVVISVRTALILFTTIHFIYFKNIFHCLLLKYIIKDARVIK